MIWDWIVNAEHFARDWWQVGVALPLAVACIFYLIGKDADRL